MRSRTWRPDARQRFSEAAARSRQTFRASAISFSFAKCSGKLELDKRLNALKSEYDRQFKVLFEEIIKFGIRRPKAKADWLYRS